MLADDLKPSNIGSGNKCGHNPQKPVFYTPDPSHKNKCWFIKKIMTALKSTFFLPHESLINLLLLNKSYKKLRTEALEAICRVAQVLIYYTDLKTMKAGIPNKITGVLEPISIQTIADRAQMSISRVKRALRNLTHAEYYESIRQTTRHSEGVYESTPSIKCLTELFFTHIGITKTKLDKIKKYKKGLSEGLSGLYRDSVAGAKRLRHKIMSKKNPAIKHDTEKIPKHIEGYFFKKWAFPFKK